MKHSASRRGWAATLALLAVLVLAPQAGLTAMPQTINYQGSLSDSLGAPVNGTVDMTFKLYSDSGGVTQLWTETQLGVTVTNGVFNVTLGSVTPLNSADFDNPVWLGIAVGADPEMTPLQPITAVGYALKAHSVEIDADTLAGLACSSGQIASWNGAAWACASATVDTTLTEAEVETFVTNGALDFASGSTLGGAAIQTGTDADTLAGLVCTSGQIASWNGAAWVCAADADTLANTTCPGAGFVVKTDGLGGWSCQADSTLTEPEVETFVTNGVIDLASGSTVGGAAIQTGADADTLAGLVCTSGQVAKWNGTSWACAADVDTDTQLTEAQVETFVTNGAVNLFAGTTLGGAAIQTGAEADTLGGLACTTNQIAKWNGTAWVCAADADTNTGVTGVNWVASASTPVGAGASVTVTATCGATDVATGGGFLTDSATVWGSSSYPDTVTNPATAWKVVAQNSDAVGHNVTAYVICVTP